MKKIIGLLCGAVLLASCTTKKSSKNIAVFIPGIMADSPIYANLAKGVQSAVDEFNSDKTDSEKATYFIMEAGTNQAEWSQKIISLCSTGKYDVIISSNPSLPDLVNPITQQFPNQKFILLDAENNGNKNVYSVSYDQTDQAYLTGYISALMSKSHKIALIAAQEYPVMNNILYPYFKKGAEAAISGTECEFRVVGNWYDATKGMEIADNLIKGGVDVILPICGGASQGVITSAVNNKAYIAWFDSNGFDKAPGTVISSTVTKQEKLAQELTNNYLSGKIEWGCADSVGLKDGYIEFIQDDPIYQDTVPEHVRTKMKKIIENTK